MGAKQKWAQKKSDQLYSVSSGGNSCIDEDVGVHSIEMYSCHEESAAGNQAWKLPSGADPIGVITSVQSGRCWQVNP